jgi:hypothetical protein
MSWASYLEIVLENDYPSILLGDFRYANVLLHSHFIKSRALAGLTHGNLAEEILNPHSLCIDLCMASFILMGCAEGRKSPDLRPGGSHAHGDISISIRAICWIQFSRIFLQPHYSLPGPASLWPQGSPFLAASRIP